MLRNLTHEQESDTVDDRQYIYQTKKSLSKVISKPV